MNDTMNDRNGKIDTLNCPLIYKTDL